MLKWTPVTWHTDLSALNASGNFETYGNEDTQLNSLRTSLSFTQAFSWFLTKHAFGHLNGRRPFLFGPMFAQFWDCAVARGGGVNDCSYPEDSCYCFSHLGASRLGDGFSQKAFEPLRFSEWFIAYLDICREFLHLYTHTPSLSLSASVYSSLAL